MASSAARKQNVANSRYLVQKSGYRGPFSSNVVCTVFMLISRRSLLLAILVLAATYAFGGYSARHDLFPYSVFQGLKNRADARAPDDLYTADKTGRLTSGEQKKAIACPQQT